MRVVSDNLNIHTPTSFYKAFEPEEARWWTRKLEPHPTPKHGSWLNQVEMELSVASSRCLRRRIPDLATLGVELAAWAAERNAQQATIDWRFTTSDARVKLTRLFAE